MFFPLIVAEGRSLDSLIHFVELLMGATALPALVGLWMLLGARARPTSARIAFFLGMITVWLAGFSCGLLWWNEAVSDWYVAPGLSLLAGLVVCAWACRSAFWPPPLP